MATVKRYPLPGHGAVWTASLGDGRPAVVLCTGGGPAPPDLGASVAQRLARAGYTAVALDVRSDGAGGSDLAAVSAALARGELVAGLTSPAKLALFGCGDGAELARAYAARHGSVALVTWNLTAGTAGRVTAVEVEMTASGSHLAEHSLQLGEALDGLLAWLARIM
jgi:pimeloyl-ACP methyl ester carboxylesterase